MARPSSSSTPRRPYLPFLACSREMEMSFHVYAYHPHLRITVAKLFPAFAIIYGTFLVSVLQSFKSFKNFSHKDGPSGFLEPNSIQAKLGDFNGSAERASEVSWRCVFHQRLHFPRSLTLTHVSRRRHNTHFSPLPSAMVRAKTQWREMLPNWKQRWNEGKRGGKKTVEGSTVVAATQ